MKSKPFAVIFDMDGVIADTNPHHEVSIKKFCEKYGKDVSDEFLKERVYGRTNADWIPKVFGPLNEKKLKAYADEKEQLFRDLYKPHLEAINGLIPFLKHLKIESIKMAVATSAPMENADFILQGLHIEKMFDEILHSAHVTKGKPHPQIYLKACHSLGLPPEKCIVFEDSLSGVKSAQNAGCKVVGVTTTHTEDELNSCDFIIKDFSMLNISTLERLFN